MTHAYQNTRIEFHILQSFPVTCLNRDDVGAPKTAVVGGVTRARVSSQCWKRQVRLAMPGFGVKLATRTKQAASLFAKACQQAGATESQAQECGTKLAELIVDDTLLFISDSEASAFAAYAQDNGGHTDNASERQTFRSFVAEACRLDIDKAQSLAAGRQRRADAE